MGSLATAAHASENDTQHFPIGVNSIADGKAPPPGTLQFLSYSLHNWSDGLAGPTGKTLPQNFKLNVYADAPRFLYTWKPKIGPFHYTTGLDIPIVHLSITDNGRHASTTNFGDISLENYLSYVSKDHKLFFYFGFGTWMPVGSYKSTRLINAGENFWSFTPNFDITYAPSKRWELDAMIVSNINTTNHATHYHSGTDIDLDYGFTYRPFSKAQRFGIGLNGYFYKQIEDDTVHGETAPNNGNRGREFAIGPQVRYDWRLGGIALKFQHLYATENRPKGNKLWLEIAFPLSGRTRPPEGEDPKLPGN